MAITAVQYLNSKPSIMTGQSEGRTAPLKISLTKKTLHKPNFDQTGHIFFLSVD